MQIKKLQNKQKIITQIIILLVFILTIGIGVVLGKYTENQNINVNAKISKPIIILENGERVDMSNTNSEVEYNFSIKNYNEEEKLTDVKLNYTIEIISSNDKAIEYSLFNEGKEIKTNNNKTEKIHMGRDEKEKHNYMLKIKYDKNKNEDLTDIIQDIQIKVHSEQEI